MQAVAEPNTSLPRRVDIAGSVDSVSQDTLGGRMAFARMRQHMTQKQLAEKIKNKDGSAKSRATIVQYENDNIMPPLDVVALIAEQLGVSPSYIAFGEHVVEGIQHRDVEMISFPEISFGRDGPYVSSTMAWSKERVAAHGLTRESIKAYIMPHDAPNHTLTKNDLLIVNASVTAPTNEGGLYVIKTQSGMEVIKIDPHYGSGPRPKEIVITGPRGAAMPSDLEQLHFLGAVVSTTRDR